MRQLSCDITSGLLDLLFSPHGSQVLFKRRLVPSTSLPTDSVQDSQAQVITYCHTYGLTTTTIDQLLAHGFVTLKLLALLPSHPTVVLQHFPTLPVGQQKLLILCLASLDPRPEFQITQGLHSLVKQPASMAELREVELEAELEQNTVTAKPDQSVAAALELSSVTLKLLECPVCYQTCLPPRIWQCTNGHLTCHACHAHTTSCPLCRSAFTNVRPLTAEKLAQLVPTSCKNSASGCPQKLTWAEQQQHELSCTFAVGNCPVLSCAAHFLIKDTVEHISTLHSLSLDSASLRLTPGAMSFRSSISTATYLHGSSDQQNWWWGPQFVVYETTPFFFIISRRVDRVDSSDSRGHFFFWLWMGGSQVDASRFLYTLTVEGVDGEKISYTARPVSLQMSVVDIRDAQTCLLLSDSGVKRMLAGAGEKLHYRIEIIDKQRHKTRC